MKTDFVQAGRNRRSDSVRRSINRRSNIQPRLNEQSDPEGQQIQEDEELNREITLMYQEINLRYEGMSMEGRPQITRLKINAEAKRVVRKVNEALSSSLDSAGTLEDLCHKIYCAARVVTDIQNQNQTATAPNRPDREQRVPWETRLNRKIDHLRKEIGVLHTFLNSETPSRKVVKKTRKYARRVKIKLTDPQHRQKITVYTEMLKQKVAALGNRIRRYHQRTLRYKQNNLFANNQRLFFRQIETEDTKQQKETPTEEKMTAFWKDIWSQSVEHDTGARWIDTEIRNSSGYTAMPEINISESDLIAVFKRMRNWTAPGIDGIHNYWWKAFTSCHKKLANLLQSTLQNPQEIPTYFTKGLTHMIPKKGDLTQPKNYRPITCLPSAYKILTSIIRQKLYSHIKRNNILAWEQNGCKHKARGSKELLVIDNVVTKHARKRLKNISMSWIEYQRAYDSMPHSWLIKVLDIYKVDQQVSGLLRHLMST
ncbi:uncharacterized protein LOC123318293 [Coccinella septempunctata]|uniref:uncharacterized protein LOC123318293 n=1 Tax=Coccinella septempunctata TaxID=41139 RepID=UPI001D09278D|nr:uncharacterized protein LOC123318293 [Coccinella septempunctata]